MRRVEVEVEAPGTNVATENDMPQSDPHQPKPPAQRVSSPETASNVGNPSREAQVVSGEKATAPTTVPGTAESGAKQKRNP